MARKKKPGYYWRLRKRLMREVYQEATIHLKAYPPKARTYIVYIAFKDLPWGVKIVN